jgi:hypothetical protein
MEVTVKLETMNQYVIAHQVNNFIVIIKFVEYFVKVTFRGERKVFGAKFLHELRDFNISWHKCSPLLASVLCAKFSPYGQDQDCS